MELTGRRNLSALAAKKQIYEMVVDADYAPETKKKVKSIMDKFLDMATHLLEVGRICNDQGKLDDTKITHYKIHLINFVIIWKDYNIQKSNIFKTSCCYVWCYCIHGKIWNVGKDQRPRI